ncbi:MAG: OsmC family protein [Acidobacteriota bacterium]|nr:OsmC family protein [Acidobacteriota bacterium]
MSSHVSKTSSAVFESAPSTETFVNGINVAGLVQTVEAVKDNPAIAKFRFDLQNEWIEGAHNRSVVNKFYGALQNIERPQSFILHADEPPVLLGTDKGPNPGEYLLHALAACITSALIFHASAKGIVIHEVESTVEGDADLRGFLGLDENVRKGFQNIRVNFEVNADVSDEEFDELANLGPSFSPVFDTLSKGVPIAVRAQRKKK